MGLRRECIRILGRLEIWRAFSAFKFCIRIRKDQKKGG